MNMQQAKQNFAKGQEALFETMLSDLNSYFKKAVNLSQIKAMRTKWSRYWERSHVKNN